MKRKMFIRKTLKIIGMPVDGIPLRETFISTTNNFIGIKLLKLSVT
jgi:hypothetical protein